MSNQVRVSLVFSFRGETHEPAMTLDLDALTPGQQAPDWHALLAAEQGMDTYSYAYEVMQASEPSFSEATGLAAQCIEAGRFDWQRFVALRQESRILEQLQAIARETLDIASLDQAPQLRAALLRAFELGRSDGG